MGEKEMIASNNNSHLVRQHVVNMSANEMQTINFGQLHNHMIT